MTHLMWSGLVAGVVWLVAPAQQPLSDLFPKTDQILHGHIILYDWHARDFTAGDDFIVKTTDAKMHYVRIMYKPFWGFDAPQAKPEDKLDQRAFIGTAGWSFTVHSPMSVEEQGGCSSAAHYYEEDDVGTRELPTYMPTPGAVKESAPSVNALPCLILTRDGLRQESDPKHKQRHL
jgi:hypothetical protein